MLAGARAETSDSAAKAAEAASAAVAWEARQLPPAHGAGSGARPAWLSQQTQRSLLRDAAPPVSPAQRVRQKAQAAWLAKQQAESATTSAWEEARQATAPAYGHGYTHGELCSERLDSKEDLF